MVAGIIAFSFLMVLLGVWSYRYEIKLQREIRWRKGNVNH